MKPLYHLENLKFRYQLGSQHVDALRGVSFKINRGDRVCLCGPSGSGKSTLLNLLGLIEPVQEGQLEFEGKSLKTLGSLEQNRIRRFELGFIFQSFHLFPVLTAQENVEYFLARQGLKTVERNQRVKESLEAVGLWEHRLKKPLEMSGGQRQRVAIARAIAKRPKVMIADEPTASLDQKTGSEIMNIFLEANRQHHTTLIVSSHDPMVHGLFKDQIHLKDGVSR